jgi:hypothetical protein
MRGEEAGLKGEEAGMTAALMREGVGVVLAKEFVRRRENLRIPLDRLKLAYRDGLTCRNPKAALSGTLRAILRICM